jgi:bla regulator protein blaR1
VEWWCERMRLAGRGWRTALAASGMAAIALPIAVGIVHGPMVRAQSTAAQASTKATGRPQSAPSAIQPDSTEWQTAAGGKMAFDAASVKPSTEFVLPPFPLNSNNFKPPGNRLSAAFPLETFISFAYKLDAAQRKAASVHWPAWLRSEGYTIMARAEGNPSKDQMRLMMQSLLADRFRLAVHFETEEVPVYAMTLVKAGTTGPKLRPHSEGPPCPADIAAEPGFKPPPKTGEIFPAECDNSPSWFKADGTALVGSRNSTMALLADTIYFYGSMSGELDKPVIDKTGLDGRFDYVIEWNGHLPGVLPPDVAAPPPDPQGTTFLEAVRHWLGLKLVLSKGPIRMLVIDHVEKPSEN